jgi:hypothetical protein
VITDVLSTTTLVVATTGTVLKSVDIIVSGSVSTGSVVVLLGIIAVETVVVDVAGVVVRDGVEVTTLRTWHGIVRTLETTNL